MLAEYVNDTGSAEAKNAFIGEVYVNNVFLDSEPKRYLIFFLNHIDE